MLSAVANAVLAPEHLHVAFPTVLRAFDAHLLALGLAARTRHKYRYELTCYWCDWCAVRELDIITATRAELNLYLAELPGQGSKRSDATRALKSFYGFLAGEYRVDDPSKHLRIGHPKLAPAPHLDPEDARSLLRAAFRKEPRRGWAMILALHTGARVTSLAALRPADVDLEHHRIYFRVAKGDRPYDMPLDDAAAAACRALVIDARDAGRGTLLGVGPDRFRQWVHEAEQLAGLERVWPHLLRHEFSNRVAAHGDPEAWRKLMNHADLSQWSRYVHADDARLRSALR